MKRRGRPPYPDLLTPREQEVLALLREGLSNDQIAERLGVSLAGAKYHVSEILGKLGVSSREEAARWQPERPWWVGAFAPIASLRHRLGWAPQLAIAAAVVALAAGVGLLVWGLTRTDSSGLQPPFHIVGPLRPTEALSGEHLAASGFILDVPTGRVYVLEKDPKNFREGDSYFATLWRDDNTLLVEGMVGGARRAYYASLNGRIEPALLGTPIGPPIVTFSADEKWLFARIGQSEIDVGRAGENASLRLTNILSAQWAPIGSTLALIGNVCAGFDVFTFNPATQELRNLTASLHPLVFGVAWRPDGAVLAADIVPLGEHHRVLGLIDATSGDVHSMIDVPIDGGLSPQMWSPSGARLLFDYGSGHGACEGEEPVADPFAPPPSQTTVEHIGS